MPGEEGGGGGIGRSDSKLSQAPEGRAFQSEFGRQSEVVVTNVGDEDTDRELNLFRSMIKSVHFIVFIGCQG